MVTSRTVRPVPHHWMSAVKEEPEKKLLQLSSQEMQEVAQGPSFKRSKHGCILAVVGLLKSG